jgi:hypothetical protein
MNILSRIAAMSLVCFAGAAALAQQPPAAATNRGDSLVLVKSRQVDKAWLLPGADFRPYRKVLLRKAEVVFQHNWLRDVNSNSISRIGRVTPAEALKIVDDARAGFDQVWAAAFTSAGFEVVAAPGDDVIEVVPRVVDLYVNAPDVSSPSITRSYTVEAGEATLKMDVRDSRLGTLLGRVSDHRPTDSAMRARLATAATNRAEFEHLFATWARIAVQGLQDLKGASPLPDTLQAGHKTPAFR